MKHFAFLLAFTVLSLYTKAQTSVPDTGLPFKILNTRNGEYITLTRLADYMNKTDVLFWGEEHNDSIGHLLEQKMLKLLSERFREKLVLSLEMFETDCQVLLDDYLGGFITKEKLVKDARAWANYEDYSPMVEYAREQHIPVVAANSPRRYNSLMSKRGPRSLDSLSPGAKKYLAKLPVYVPTKGKYYRKFIGIMGGEENIHSPNMFASQCLWDATMAKSIAIAADNNKKGGLVMHVCGRFHCDEYLGTVSQLMRKHDNLAVTTISCFPADDFAKPDIEQYERLADFVILVKKP